MAAVAGLLRGLPCWNFDEDDDVGLSTTASSLMVTPGVVQHSTPLSASKLVCSAFTLLTHSFAFCFVQLFTMISPSADSLCRYGFSYANA